MTAPALRRAVKRRLAEAGDRDRGTVIPLIIIFALIASLLLLVVIDATQLFMKQRSFASVADGAALAAAQEIDKGTLYTTGGIKGADLPLDSAQNAVDAYININGIRARMPGLGTVLVSQDSTAPNSIVVTVKATIQLPVVSWFTTDSNGVELKQGVGITETASAILRCGDTPAAGVAATCG